MLIAGTGWLEKIVGDINALNVYPVPDGDCGTNMFFTMRSCLAEADSADGYDCHVETVQPAVNTLGEDLIADSAGDDYGRQHKASIEHPFLGLFRHDRYSPMVKPMPRSREFR